MRINATELRRQCETLGVRRASGMLTEALGQGQLVPEDFSIRDLFEQLVPDGGELLRLMSQGGNLFEAEGITTGSFNVIMSNLVMAAILESYEQEEHVFSKLAPTLPATFRDGEIYANVSGLGDPGQIIKEGDPYPYVGLTDDWIRLPAPKNRGFIVPITKQALLYDQTATVMARAREVGPAMSLNKEKRLIDAYIDENTTAHRYRRRDRAAVASYGDNSGDHDFDNLEGSNALVDWTDLDNAEQLANAMVDPMTGEPVTVAYTDIVHTMQLQHAVNRIINATEIRYIGSGAPSETLVRNPYANKYRSITSRLLASRMATDTSWYIGNVAKTIAYAEAWKVTVSQAPSNSEAEFERDIVARFKASECGAAVVTNPRHTVKSTQ